MKVKRSKWKERPHTVSAIGTSCIFVIRGMTDLENDIRAHCKAVSDDWFFVRSLAVPAVQFHAPATRQQCLPVYLHRRLARQLMSWMPTTSRHSCREHRTTIVVIYLTTFGFCFSSLSFILTILYATLSKISFRKSFRTAGTKFVTDRMILSCKKQRQSTQDKIRVAS